MFGVKDLFTTINLIGGSVGICLCIDGRPFAAGVSIILGYLLGDTLDGYVARKLGTANQFGAEFDTIADHTSHVIAPAAVVYTVYKDVDLVPDPYQQVLAMALAASMIVSVSIRHARNIVAPVTFKGVWAGLPRSVLGFLAIGYCNATVAPHLPGGWWLGVVLIPAMGIATLTYLPFPSHHLTRRHFLWARVGMVVGLFGPFVLAAFRPHMFFDAILAVMTFYSLTAWTTMTAAERTAYRAAVASRQPA